MNILSERLLRVLLVRMDKEPKAAPEVTATKPKTGVQREEKSKRTITKPSYLKD